MPRKWTEAKVVELDYASPNVRSLTIEIDQEEAFAFRPGQFITFDLDIGEKRLERWRSYSIANLPNDKNRLDFIISRIDGGRASDFFFKKLKANDTLRLKGPQGTFVLPENLDQEIIMICTGTGVAPFKAMIDYIYQNNVPHKAIHLIFGTRHLDGVLYREYFEDLADKETNFKYSIALSREPYNDYQGYVHDIYKAHYNELSDNRLFMLCGWQNMIDEAVLHLSEMGYRDDKIVYELYG